MLDIQDLEASLEPAPDCAIALSRHASVRAKTRGVRVEHIQLCLDLAEPRRSRGALVYVLKPSDLPANCQHASSAVGTTVVESEDGTIMTVYRRKRAERISKRRGQDSTGDDLWAA